MRTFGALGHRAFAMVWMANAVALCGIATFDAACAWLMTSLDPEPVMVSLVQTATVLPMFLLTLVGGALADVVRPRRFLIANTALIALVVAAFAAVVASGRATSASLLATIFVLSGAWALNAPAWLAIIPEAAPPEELESAIAANGLAYTLSRLAGPPAFGLATAIAGASAPFWAFFACNAAAIALLLAGRAPQRSEARPPPERVWRAIGVGLRHALHNRRLHGPLLRALAFFAFASASAALLPVVARQALGRPGFYAALLSAGALGAIGGSLAFVALRRRVGLDRVVDLGCVLVSAALVLFGASRSVPVLLAASLVAGFAGILALTGLTIAAQQVLPTWVRGRGLSVLLTVAFGSVTVGSAGWGTLASVDDPAHALLAAAAGLALTLPLTARLRLGGAAAVDLAPSLHYRRIDLARAVEDDEGPVLVIVDYRVGPAERAAFVDAIAEVGRERRRDGATRWGAFQDVEDDGRWVETFSLDSWSDLRRLRERVTRADRQVERRIEAMLQAPRTVRFHVAPQRRRNPPFVEAASVQAVVRALRRT